MACAPPRRAVTRLWFHCPMPVRLRLDLAYDGTAFAGWARQPGQLTVEGTLEEALGVLTRAAPRLTVAGRTDAGVHARGQVAHVDVPVGAFTRAPGRSGRAPSAAFAARLAGVGGRLRGQQPDVVVQRVAVAPPGFDARFSAIWRRYVYRISDRLETRDPLERHRVLWARRPLDDAAMAATCGGLLGEHDFLSFCKPREGATTIRTLQRLEVRREPGGLIEIEVQADAFCHSMVRALVGALLAVGEGRRPAAWPASVLAARNHDHMAVVPAHGLTLEAVGYPPDAELAERARIARARRA